MLSVTFSLQSNSILVYLQHQIISSECCVVHSCSKRVYKQPYTVNVPFLEDESENVQTFDLLRKGLICPRIV